MIQISSKNILVLMLLSFIAINSLFSASKTELQLDSSSKIVHRILLIGDAGEDPSSSGPVLQLLHSRMTDLDQEDISVVFLGDNIYPEGLHKKDHPLRSQDEARINAQLDAVKHHQGEVVFIPGNHDWQQGGKEGFKFNKRQEDYIQKYLDRKAYLPSDGCSGPEAVELSEELILITIDTQWWLHQYRKGRGEKDDCDFSTTTDFVLEFKELLKKYRRKHILVVGHHPLYSNGHHVLDKHDSFSEEMLYELAMKEMRTNSSYLEDDMRSDFAGVLEKVARAFQPITPEENSIILKFREEIEQI